jgi:hypothetical protein
MKQLLPSIYGLFKPTIRYNQETKEKEIDKSSEERVSRSLAFIEDNKRVDIKKVFENDFINNNFNWAIEFFLGYLEHIDRLRSVHPENRPVFELVFSHQRRLGITGDRYSNYEDKLADLRRNCTRDFPFTRQFCEEALRPALNSPFINAGDLFAQLGFVGEKITEFKETIHRVRLMEQVVAELNTKGFTGDIGIRDLYDSSDLSGKAKEILIMMSHEKDDKERGKSKHGRGDKGLAMHGGREKLISYSEIVYDLEHQKRKLASMKREVEGAEGFKSGVGQFGSNLSRFLQMPELRSLEGQMLPNQMSLFSCVEFKREKKHRKYEYEQVFLTNPVYCGSQEFSDKRLQIINDTIKRHFCIDIQQYNQRKRLELYLQRTWKALGLSDETFARINDVLVIAGERDLHEVVYNEDYMQEVVAQLGDLYTPIIVVDYLEFFGGIAKNNTEGLLGDLNAKALSLWKHLVKLSPEEYERVKSHARMRPNYGAEDYYYFRSLDVPPRDIPREIRAYVLYMRTPNPELLNYKPDDHYDISLDEYGGKSQLSDLSVAKSGNQRRFMGFNGTPKELQQLVEQESDGKDTEIVRREIIHAMSYLSVNDGYLFIRELISNSIDAIKKTTESEVSKKEGDFSLQDWVKSAKMLLKSLRRRNRDDPEVNRTVHIEHFMQAREDEQDRLIVVAQDGVGMTFREVINYLLVRGERSSSEKGKFGQKFFTVLQGAEEVFVKTGVGDGQVTYCKLVPQYDEHDQIVDVLVEYDIRNEADFKGTVIQKVVKSDFPEMEAALLKDATITYGGLVDGNLVRIDYGGEQINQPQGVLAQRNLPDFGELKIYDASEDAVTQNGIFVRDLGPEYFLGVPTHVQKALTDHGIVIDLPTGIELIVSGNDIAGPVKEKVFSLLQDAIPVLAMQSYLRLFAKGAINLDSLPYDFFSQGEEQLIFYKTKN